MPVFRLGPAPIFPPIERAEPDGLLAVGGDLSPGRLLQAYRLGIFPWYDEPGGPILWWSPDPRLILEPSALHISRSLAQSLRRGTFAVRFDTAFAQVIRHCSEAARPGQDGTWITPEMQAAYIHLHELGFAHCAESWEGGELVGGVYGIALGRCFFGESMFARRSDASKVAFVGLVHRLEALGTTLIDCQVRTEHLVSLGAREIPRAEFARRLAEGLAAPTVRGPWT